MPLKNSVKVLVLSMLFLTSFYSFLTVDFNLLFSDSQLQIGSASYAQRNKAGKLLRRILEEVAPEVVGRATAASLDFALSSKQNETATQTSLMFLGDLCRGSNGLPYLHAYDGKWYGNGQVVYPPPSYVCDYRLFVDASGQRWYKNY